jgi:hypothetical protein
LPKAPSPVTRISESCLSGFWQFSEITVFRNLESHKVFATKVMMTSRERAVVSRDEGAGVSPHFSSGLATGGFQHGMFVERAFSTSMVRDVSHSGDDDVLEPVSNLVQPLGWQTARSPVAEEQPPARKLAAAGVLEMAFITVFAASSISPMVSPSARRFVFCESGHHEAFKRWIAHT